MLTINILLCQFLDSSRCLPSSSNWVAQIPNFASSDRKNLYLCCLFCLPNASFHQVLWTFSLSCVVQKSLKDLRSIYVQILGSPLVWFPPCFIPYPSISSHPENLKVYPLTLQAKRIVLYCLSSSYPIACGQGSAFRKKAKKKCEYHPVWFPFLWVGSFPVSVLSSLHCHQNFFHSLSFLFMEKLVDASYLYYQNQDCKEFPFYCIFQQLSMSSTCIYLPVPN